MGLQLLIFLILLLPTNYTKQQKEFHWKIGKTIFTAGETGAFDEISVKDPSLVFYNNLWHVFYTARDKNEYTTAYVSAENLDELNKAKRHQLKTVRGETKYGCAPQVFFFDPQKKWYLIFQNRDSNYQAAFVTTPTISDPNSWSLAQNLIEKDSRKKWIDFWIIADKEKVYLFYTEDHNEIKVRSTSITNFPNSWGKSKTVFDGVHEAVHIYKVKGKTEFHMIFEINENGIRSFGLAIAKHLEGPWKLHTNNYATGNQLHYSESQTIWTEMVSHGEVIRSGYDQFMEYEPNNCQWLIQGLLKKDLKIKYEMLPWSLGLIQQVKNE